MANASVFVDPWVGAFDGVGARAYASEDNGVMTGYAALPNPAMVCGSPASLAEWFSVAGSSLARGMRVRVNSPGPVASESPVPAASVERQREYVHAYSSSTEELRCALAEVSSALACRRLPVERPVPERGFSYLELLRPEVRDQARQRLGAEPMLTRVATLPMDWFLPPEEAVSVGIIPCGDQLIFQVGGGDGRLSAYDLVLYVRADLARARGPDAALPGILRDTRVGGIYLAPCDEKDAEPDFDPALLNVGNPGPPELLECDFSEYDRSVSLGAREVAAAVYDAIPSCPLEVVRSDGVIDFDPDDDGFCYLRLYRREHWPAIARSLGRWPTVADLLAVRLDMWESEPACEVRDSSEVGRLHVGVSRPRPLFEVWRDVVVRVSDLRVGGKCQLTPDSSVAGEVIDGDDSILTVGFDSGRLPDPVSHPNGESEQAWLGDALLTYDVRAAVVSFGYDHTRATLAAQQYLAATALAGYAREHMVMPRDLSDKRVARIFKTAYRGEVRACFGNWLRGRLEEERKRELPYSLG